MSAVGDELSPVALRRAVRSGTSPITHTSGLCPGHLQANIVILPLQYALDFDRFVAANSKACPLLYRSSPGEVGAPPLAADSDIRTDVPLYRVFMDGELKKETTDISEYWKDDFVTYYFGCSFTFENALQAAGVPLRNVEQKRNVTMYRTNIPCATAGPFQCNMVVSMRPIPADLVDLSKTTTAPLVRAHGDPIHAGDPATIGVADLMTPDFGDAVQFLEGDVPVFWACGVTSAMAAISAKPSICITHAPGSMFVCDTLETDPLVRCTSLEQRLTRLEEIILQDHGHRGVAHLFVPGDFAAAAAALCDAQCVGIVTGFPCNGPHEPPYETDGPPGAAALCQMLLRLHKKAVIIGEKALLEVMRCCVEDEGVTFVEYPPSDGGSPEDFLKSHQITHLLAIERSSRAKDGKYYTMRARDISVLCGPLDDLFEAAEQLGIGSIGIGDGGNEIGMKKVNDQICKYIPHGPTIASATGTQYIISAGVSNWGGFALVTALGLMKDKKAEAADILAVDQQRTILERLVEMGVRDGATQQLQMSVDGLQFDGEHDVILRQMAHLLLGGEE